jgi:hypothetical protein
LLPPSEIKRIQSLALPERQARYLELATKIARLVILTPLEIDELIILRDLLQTNAENMRRFGTAELQKDEAELTKSEKSK